MTKEDLQQIAELLSAQKQEIAKMVDSKLEPLKDDIRYTRMLIEKQEHNVQLIAEQYTDIAEKLDKANDRAAQLDDMRTRLRTLETVVMNHTAAIKELRKAE
jgi:small-conductance mechanosensitive channel